MGLEWHSVYHKEFPKGGQIINVWARDLYTGELRQHLAVYTEHRIHGEVKRYWSSIIENTFVSGSVSHWAPLDRGPQTFRYSVDGD